MFIRIAVCVHCVFNVLCSCFLLCIPMFIICSCVCSWTFLLLELFWILMCFLSLFFVPWCRSLFLIVFEVCFCCLLLVLLFELVCFFVLCLARWFQFFVVVSVFGYVFLLLFVVIALVLSVLASPSIARKRICCGPSAKSGRQQIGRASNRLDRLRSIFVGRN
jgi:hypothetical protein